MTMEEFESRLRSAGGEPLERIVDPVERY